MKKRVVALVFLGLLFAGFIGLRKSLDAVETQSKTAKFFNKILTRVVKDVEAIEKGVRKVITEIGYAISLPFRENIKKLQIPIAQNPYATTKAFVRKGGVQSPQEVEYLKLRRPIARRALEAFLGKTFPPHVILPDVMVSLSGGGNRASILSWGFLRALEKIGLLDCTTHVTSLSGSTWMLLPWLVSGLPLEQFKQLLFNSVIHGPKFRTPENIKHAMDFLLRKVAFKRSTTLIDLYGIGLGTILFHGLGENRDPLQVYMNSLQDPLNTALIPYPIITSISVPDVRWFTATPHEFGSASLGYYVPIWAFDRDFNNGSSVDMKLYPDRVSVSSLLAMSSAAIGISFGDFYAHTAASIKDKLLKKILSAILEKSPLERIRLLYYEKKNYLRGITGLPVYDTLSGKTWGDVSSIKYTDAGIIWGNPLPPLFDRMRSGVPTILLVMDASGTVGVEKLKLVKAFADGDNPRKKMFPFPDIPAAEGVGQKSMSVLKNNDVLVLYFPRIIDRDMIETQKNNPELQNVIERLNFDMGQRMKGEYSTFNLKYSQEKAEDLASVSLFNVISNKERIKSAMTNFISHYVQQETSEQKAQSKASAEFLNRMGVAGTPVNKK